MVSTLDAIVFLRHTQSSQIQETTSTQNPNRSHTTFVDDDLAIASAQQPSSNKTSLSYVEPVNPLPEQQEESLARTTSFFRRIEEQQRCENHHNVYKATGTGGIPEPGVYQANENTPPHAVPSSSRCAFKMALPQKGKKRGTKDANVFEQQEQESKARTPNFFGRNSPFPQQQQQQRARHKQHNSIKEQSIRENQLEVYKESKIEASPETGVYQTDENTPPNAVPSSRCAFKMALPQQKGKKGATKYAAITNVFEDQPRATGALQSLTQNLSSGSLRPEFGTLTPFGRAAKRSRQEKKSNDTSTLLVVADAYPQTPVQTWRTHRQAESKVFTKGQQQLSWDRPHCDHQYCVPPPPSTNGYHHAATQPRRHHQCVIRTQPKVVRYSKKITACEKRGEWWLALALFDEMKHQDIRPDATIYSALIRLCQLGAWWRHALELLREMETSKVQPEACTYRTLINACQKCGRPKKALELFGSMSRQGIPPDAEIYNALINVCGTGKKWEKTLELKREMDDRGIEPQKSSYRALINACEKGGQCQQALELLLEMNGRGIEAGTSCYKAVLRSFFNSRKFSRALWVLRYAEANERDAFRRRPGPKAKTWDLRGCSLPVACIWVTNAIFSVCISKMSGFQSVGVITGCGNNSLDGIPVLKWKVPEFLEDYLGIETKNVKGNEGMVTIESWAFQTLADNATKLGLRGLAEKPLSHWSEDDFANIDTLRIQSGLNTQPIRGAYPA